MVLYKALKEQFRFCVGVAIVSLKDSRFLKSRKHGKTNGLELIVINFFSRDCSFGWVGLFPFEFVTCLKSCGPE